MSIIEDNWRYYVDGKWKSRSDLTDLTAEDMFWIASENEGDDSCTKCQVEGCSEERAGLVTGSDMSMVFDVIIFRPLEVTARVCKHHMDELTIANVRKGMIPDDDGVPRHSVTLEAEKVLREET